MAYKTNVLGPFLLIQLCTPMLVQTARKPGRRTCVWNTGSGAAMCPSPWALAYSSTKVRRSNHYPTVAKFCRRLCTV
jgi:NAD(P)-dependent dehydrogenase (short-subunit alcohol dehydrogenase family)